MKFSGSWLREWVNISLNDEQLAHQITMAGLEVDGIDPVAGHFTGVVIGEVVACEQHPDADKLRVTKVNIGEDELLDIVCGASNCRIGLKVVVATVGAILPNDFKIKKAKLRGQPSHGMLCSFSELGIQLESNGIIELPQDAPLGQDIRDYLVLNDVIIDVDLTANRADCLSLKGLAREVAVLNQMAMEEPKFQAIVPSIDDTVPVIVDAVNACPRYLGRMIRNVNVTAATPLWMQEKLRRSGIRSIDPIVDITNYVMLEQGQPMHAFDWAKIDTSVVVRLAKQNEKLILLDGNEVNLTEDTLVIADQNKALAIAGIFGGAASAVSEKTQDILLESAFFTPDAIRGRARRYGLHTDSSHRFERGVDPELQYLAMERATQLIVDICGGQVGEIVEQKSTQNIPQAQKIVLHREKLDNLLGHYISCEQVADILARLGCFVEKMQDGWVTIAPSWRFDIAIEEDLIEEVGRVFGYDNIPNQAPNAHLYINENKEENLPLKRVRHLLADRGYYEAITYSFVEPTQQTWIEPHIKPLLLPNPISADMSAMRLSLLTGLLNTVAHNQKRQQTRVRLFEAGLRFIPDDHFENGIRQEMMLAGIISGSRCEEHWNIPENTVDFFDLKGDVEAILELTGNEQNFRFIAAPHPALHPGQSAKIEVNGQSVGFIGTLHPELERKFSLNGKTIVFEIEWAAIAQRRITNAQALSKYPANRRDIALIVDEHISSDEVVRICLDTQSQLIVDATLFDLYKGKGIESGYKSLAIALTLQSNERTLEESEISNAVSGVICLLKEKLNAQLRD